MNPTSAKRVNYRKLAFDHYTQNGQQAVCAHCGFGIRDVLEVAHLDGDRSHNDLTNLVILCPNCHKMHDLDLIATETIITMRDRPKVVVWKKRMKDAGAKAKKTLMDKRKWRAAGLKAAEARRRNKASAEPPSATSNIA
jgi:5-methylcytosine-specific restriction endonuclease McrA